MKLRILAEAAASFYSTPNLRHRPKKEKAHRKHARHICQWVACDAGYKKAIVARFWGMDRTSVHYGWKTVNNKIDTDPSVKIELKEFMEIVAKFMDQWPHINKQTEHYANERTTATTQKP